MDEIVIPEVRSVRKRAIEMITWLQTPEKMTADKARQIQDYILGAESARNLLLQSVDTNDDSTSKISVSIDVGLRRGAFGGDPATVH